MKIKCVICDKEITEDNCIFENHCKDCLEKAMWDIKNIINENYNNYNSTKKRMYLYKLYEDAASLLYIDEIDQCFDKDKKRYSNTNKTK